MLFEIKGENNNIFKINICFDLYGNLYLDISNIKNDPYFNDSNDSNDANLFQINIDGKNIPIAERGDYPVISDTNTNLKKFMFGINHTLKDLVKDTLDDDDEGGLIEYFNYFPEDEDHYDVEESNNNTENSDDCVIDEDYDRLYGRDNKPFNFTTHNIEDNDMNDININDREDGNITSLYDTYVYNNGILILKATSQTNSIYRIQIHNDGNFLFRPIGYSSTVYKVFIDKNKNIKFV